MQEHEIDGHEFNFMSPREMTAGHESGAFIATAVSKYGGEAVTSGVSYSAVRNASGAGNHVPQNFC